MTSQLHTCLNCSQTTTSSIYNTLHLPHILLLLFRVCIVSSTWPSATTVRLPRKNIIQIIVLPTIEAVLLFKPADVFLSASSCGFFQFPLELGIFFVSYSNSSWRCVVTPLSASPISIIRGWCIVRDVVLFILPWPIPIRLVRI